MLRAWAAGLHAWEAATELIILHDRWLTRDDFLRSLVGAVDDAWTRDGRTVPMASIDWQGSEPISSTGLTSADHPAR